MYLFICRYKTIREGRTKKVEGNFRYQVSTTHCIEASDRRVLVCSWCQKGWKDDSKVDDLRLKPGCYKEIGIHIGIRLWGYFIRASKV